MTLLSAENFEYLLQANRILSSTLDIHDLLRAVMELAARVVKAQTASLLLLDEKSQELYFDVALGDAGEEVKTVRLKMGEGLAGWVAKNRKPVLVNDTHTDPRWSKKTDERTTFITQQMLAVPLLSKDKLIGVVEALNHRDGSHFSTSDVSALEAFASQAAVAIDNARLFAEVRGEKEKLSAVIAAMSDGAVMTDEVGRITLTNRAADNMFGPVAKDSLGRLMLSDLARDFDSDPPLENIHAAATSIGTHVELKRRVGQPLYLSSAVDKLTQADGRVTGFLFVFHDVTEARREEILKRNFLSLISHKLKTPLVTIAGYAPMLLEDTEAPFTEFQRKALENIKTQSHYLSSLVDKLINFSLVESDTLILQKRPVQLMSFLLDLLPVWEATLSGQSAEIVVDDSLRTLPAIKADPDRLREVLRNLVENAIKFNPKPKKTVRIQGHPSPEGITVTVADNGTGLPPEELPKLFQKFYQVDQNFTGQVQGVGLGLALVKRMVEAHGGTVSVASVLGEGSVFSVTFPVAR